MQRFWRDDRGTYAVMAGIVTLPLLLGVGTAVDYSVGVLNQKELQSVLDSAVLAGALQLGAGNGAASDAAATYFNANVPGKLTGDAGQVPTTKFWVDGTTLYGTAAYQVPTSFMRLATISSLPVGATSGAVMGTKGIELALVLDVSSSMEDNNKIGSLQAAASALVNIIYSDHPDTTGGVTTRANTYISIVPFDGRVNTQKYNANWLNANPPARCTEPRAVNVANDAPPSVETFTPTPPQMLVNTCQSASAVFGTTDKETALRWIAALATNGKVPGHGTAIWEGAAWGFRLLSPKWQNFWPTMPSGVRVPMDYDKTPGKVAVIISDGNNDPNAYGEPNLSQLEADLRTRTTCSNMKAAGIEVYTIGLDRPDVSQSILGLCASDAQHYFNPSSNTGASGSDQLAVAFKTIAQRLIVGNPRLVM